MPEAPRYIRNYEAVVSAFGRWPSFHDSPVLAFEHVDDRITLALQAWEMTSQVDERGYFVLHKHHIVRFAFHGVTRPDLAQFVPQNILFALEFSSCSEFDASGRFTVGLDSVLGGDGSFTATFGEVTDVVPCDKDSQPV